MFSPYMYKSVHSHTHFPTYFHEERYQERHLSPELFLFICYKIHQFLHYVLNSKPIPAIQAGSS